MKKMPFFILAGLIAAQPLFAQNFAQNAMPDSISNSMANAQSALPTVRTEGDVTYVSGGVGEDEANAMKRAAGKYPLELMFINKAKPRDSYTSDVQVKITNQRGESVLDTTSEGPYFLASLPNGTYRIEATNNGETRKQQTTVKKGSHRRIVFSWKEIERSDEK